MARGDPCRGLFPFDAERDRGQVTVALAVTKTGLPAAPRIVEEVPRGQGFAGAARACVRRLLFEPAVNAAGRPRAARSIVRLHFARHRDQRARSPAHVR